MWPSISSLHYIKKLGSKQATGLEFLMPIRGKNKERILVYFVNNFLLYIYIYETNHFVGDDFILRYTFGKLYFLNLNFIEILTLHYIYIIIKERIIIFKYI